jgi:hypothetical protein
MHATPEHTFRDSLMILHLLRDDIILWSAEMLQDGAHMIPPGGGTALIDAFLEGQGDEVAEKR